MFKECGCSESESSRSITPVWMLLWCTMRITKWVALSNTSETMLVVGLLTVLQLVSGATLKGTHWAVLVSSSYGWENYRHQADMYHAYPILRANGYPEEQASSPQVSPESLSATRPHSVLSIIEITDFKLSAPSHLFLYQKVLVLPPDSYFLSGAQTLALGPAV